MDHGSSRLQVISLLEDTKRHYRTSNEEFAAYLTILGAVLPESHTLPSTFHMFRKRLRAPMAASVDKEHMFTGHLCSDVQCDYLYKQYPGHTSDTCPVAGCQTPAGDSSPRFRCSPMIRDASSGDASSGSGNFIVRIRGWGVTCSVILVLALVFHVLQQI